MTDTNFDPIDPNESFSVIAKKIRMSKVDQKEIQKLKQESLMKERERQRKKKCITTIQRIYKGHLFRKKFKTQMDELNTKTIINFLKEKRKERIQKNAKEIISYYLNLYINKKRSYEDKVIEGYKNYCADLISSTYLSYRIRSRLKPLRDLISSKKKIILKYALAYKIRLLLRSSSIQNILVEIANLKSVLNSKDTVNDNLNEEFKQRLNRFYLNFIDEFNYLKASKGWVDQAKTENPWLLKYLSLVYKDNPKYNLESTGRKTKDNYSKSKSKGNIPLDNNNNNNNNFNQYDERPIKPMKLTGFNMEDAYPKEGEEIPKKRIVRNKNKNNNIKNKINDNENEEINQDKIIDDSNLNNEEDNFNNNKNQYINYDDRPIKSKAINYEEMFGGDNNYEFDQDPNKFIKKQIKKKPQNRNNIKKPKYDARKAIEEAKQKELKEGKKEKKSSFRDFVREMKKIAKEEKELKKNVDSQISNFGNSQSQIKDSFKNNNNTTSNINYYNNSSKETIEKNKNKSNKNINNNNVKEEGRGRKAQPIEIELRKKLHDLERSPPPKLNIKNAKSKINCWTNNNEKNTVNIKTFSQNKKKMNYKNDEWKRVINDNRSINKLENDFKTIANNFNIENFFNEKENQMKEFNQIPFIKKKQNYIQILSNDSYNEIVTQLNNKYKDLNE